MSYTTTERVKGYLTGNHAIAEKVRDQAVTLRDTLPVKIWGCAIEAGSLLVKSQQTLAPLRQTITIAANGVSLSSAPILQGSVVAASDSSLGTIYIESLDYVVDYDSSTLLPKSDGALEIGQSIVVWHIPMTQYTVGEDYVIDYERAELRRMAGGSIASSETVSLDFVPVFSGFNDELVAVAVNEANSVIEQAVDPERQFGADENLVAAATCKALEIICYTAASRELSSGSGLDRIAMAWLKLAESYQVRSTKLLGSFRPPAIGPSAPTHS